MKPTLAQYAAAHRITGFEPAPDGSAIYYIADSDGQFNLWQAPTAGGEPTQLTRFTAESVRDLVVGPEQIAFLADVTGNEMRQVYLLPTGGAPRKLTDLPKVQHTLGAISPDGRYLAYSANAAGARDVDIFLHDLTTGEVRQLTHGGAIMMPAPFSPDGTYLLAAQIMANTDLNLWVIDLATGAARNMTEHPGRKAIYMPAGWRQDGAGFWYTSNDGREFHGAGIVDLQTGHREYVQTAAWDVERYTVSARHSLTAYTVNAAGTSRLTVIDQRSNSEVPIPELPRGVISQIRFAPGDKERRLFIAMSCYNQANAIYALDLERQELRLLTPPSTADLPCVAPELVYIKAFDGLEIPAWLYRPQGAAPEAKVPAVLAIHGGPELQERTDYRYSGFYQYLLSQGVAVLAPNIRGSTGFGISWQSQVLRDWGGGDLKDLEACAQYLSQLDWIDAGRLGVWGRSYGGFASLSCAARLPSYWACAVDVCGPSNLLTFADSVPPSWKPMIKAWIGDPEEDRDLLIERSPITYVDQIRCPLLVVQGAKDPRVVKAESDQMVERLRELGRPVEYLVFENEGHEFTLPANQLQANEQMAGFLLRHLSS